MLAEKDQDIGGLQITTNKLEQLLKDQKDKIKAVKTDVLEEIETKIERVEESLQEVVKQQLEISAFEKQKSQDATKGTQQSSRQLSMLQSQLETMKTITLPNAVKHLEQKIEDQRIMTKGLVDKKIKQFQKDAKKQAEQGAAEQA